MALQNAGNLVPVYTRLEDQYHRRTGAAAFVPWGIPAEPTKLLPIQFPFPGVTLSTLGWSVYDLNDTLVHPFLNTHVQWAKDTANNESYLTMLGGALGHTFDPGFYYCRFVVNSTIYYTEVLNVRQFVNRKTDWKLRISHSTNHDRILYSTGYTQEVRLDMYEKEPVLKIEEEAVLNGENEEYVEFSSVKSRRVFDIPNFPDFWLDTFQSLRYHDGTSLTKVSTSETIKVVEPEIVRKEQDVAFGLGEFSFQHFHTVTGKKVNKTIVLVDEEDLPSEEG